MASKPQFNGQTPWVREEATRPYFQQLQMQFAAHIRNPSKMEYEPIGEAPIETRRLAIYETLFFNNIEHFFSQIFPVSADVMGVTRWQEVLREYLVKHRAKTPLFHELGEEFVAFLGAEFTPKESDPEFLLELAHYEWVELALSTSPEIGFDLTQSTVPLAVDLDKSYRLSALAWPLAYEWPVHQISVDFQPHIKPDAVTTLLVYRREEARQDVIDFMAISPLLYQWLTTLDPTVSARNALEQVAQSYEISEEVLEGFAKSTLRELVQLELLQES